ncbi:hypothetical protein, conserved [Eimeria tenella]|uniref:Uncharacterized protein n=1 Tax=Eimeria tenella TaxID=5802 RepID=U6KQ30_EIMTE|nr:hypothetical protein, conserved [Eimeria tenella]CDJ40237.1 hypothetical protein, conserved [Eimeria tenella]|eukprot:XP_013230990.1 hypothetical protein, conserved [Eimeria tenella]
MVLDEMAAALPKAAQQLVHAEAAETAAAAAAGRTGKEGSRGCGISSSRSAPRRPNCLAAQGLYQEADKRFRTDPVSRGRYFRDKWKSDKFLEQQRHPAFDVKAYDAWLKNRGHLIRGRALELQQEEQRLISQLQLQQQQQQQRGGRPRRFGL